jgi:hypothetical protein
MGGWVVVRNAWVRGKTRGEYRVMKLMKQEKKRNYAFFYFAEKHFFTFLKSLHGKNKNR